MLSSSPTLAGFGSILRRPLLGWAEMAWRWSFGGAASFLLIFGLLEYFDTLPVSARELLLLRSRQPALISKAIVQIFHGSGHRLAIALLVLAVALSFAWIVLSSFGRATTLAAVVRYFQPGNGNPPENPRSGFRLRSLAGLHSLRVAALLAASVGTIGAWVVAIAISPTEKPAPGLAFLVFVTVFTFIALAWSWLNWFLSLAAVFVVSEGQDTFGAIVAAVNVCGERLGALLSVATWFGLAHGVAFFVASFLIGFPLALVQVLPRIMVFGAALLVTLLYFLVADFLYVGRLAGYVWIAQGLDRLTQSSSSPVPSFQPATFVPPQTQVDPDELILSDLPVMPRVSPAN
jgi:hypothetical protein